MGNNKSKVPAVTTATATEMQNNFGKYADMVSKGGMVVVTKNGKEIGRFVPHTEYVQFITDQLRGLLKGDCDYDELKEKELKEKYEISD